jgi:hypothetical protein
MTNAAMSLAFSSFGSSSQSCQTHLTDAWIFASRSIRCAIASITLTGLAASMLIGLMGSQIAAFFEGLEEKKLRNLERRFDG